MSAQARVCYLILCGSLLCSNGALSQGDASPEADARAALSRFLDAFNSADIAAVRRELNYPHVTHGPQGIFIADTAADFEIDFAGMRRQQGWRASRWDNVSTRQVSPDKVNFSVDFARLDADGEPYIEGNVFYVFTLQGGRWGMQYRAGDMRRGRYAENELTAASSGAREAVAAFFTAFNGADSAGLMQLHHIPQAVIHYQDNRFLRATAMDSPLLRTDFASLRARENWQRSEYQGLTVAAATPDRVILELDFRRIDRAGQAYLQIPALWVMARREGRWGLEFRSLMRSTLTD